MSNENEKQPEKKPEPKPEPLVIPEYIENMLKVNWQGHVYVEKRDGAGSRLLGAADRLKSFVPHIQENQIQTILEAFEYSGRISRSQHIQLETIAKRVLREIKGMHEALEKELEACLAEAELINAHGKALIEERKKQRTSGNVKFVDKIEEDCTVS